MPEEVMADTPELDRSDASDRALNRIRSAEIKPTCEIRSHTDKYNEDDSDSNSDNESLFSPESEEATIGRFDHVESHDQSKITFMLQNMSMLSDKSSGSIESTMPKTEDCAMWTRSSSESSPLPTSDKESESESESEDEDDLNEDEKRRKVREKFLVNFTKLQQDHNSNYTTTSINDNYADDESHEIPKSSDNERSGTASEDDSDDEFVKRGPTTTKQYHHGGKPYDRGSPPTNDDTTEEPEPDLTIREIMNNQYYTNQINSAIDELLVLPQVDNNQEWDSHYTFMEYVNNFDTSPVQSPELELQTVQPPLPSDSSSFSDNNDHSPASYNSELDSVTTEGLTMGLEGMMNKDVISNMPEGQYAFSPEDWVDLGKLDFESQQDVLETQPYHITLGDGINQRNVYAPFPSPVNNMPEIQGNTYDGMRTETHTSQSHIRSEAFLPYTTTTMQDQINVFQPTTNTLRSHSPTTQIQNSILSVINSESTSRGIVTVVTNTKDRQNIATFGQNSPDVRAQTNGTDSFNGGQTRNQRLSSVSSVQPQTPSRTASPFRIPAPVFEIHKQRSPHGWGSRRIAPWSLSSLPSVPAFERLRQEVGKDNALRAMIKLYEFTLEEYEKQNEMGDTYLMTLVSDPIHLSSRLANIVPVLDKMEIRPKSLILTNKLGYDALYLAAINCPQFDYVTGVLAAALEKTHGASTIWQRTYNSNNDTLIHVIASRGDSHENILRELLTVQTTSNRTLFDLSAKNHEGKTPLHVAVETHNHMGNGVSTINLIRQLLRYGADPVSKDNRNGDTALHLAMSSTSCRGIVQALLYNNAGKEAVNISNYAGYTPLHCAAALLNAASPETQKDVCQRLIDAGAKINIANRQNKMPLALVAPDRREMIEKIFRKKS